MAATYSKLQTGDWGVRVTSDVKPGDRVSVTRRDGTVKAETVGEVVWKGGGVSICTIVRSDAQTKTCWECGRSFTYGDCKENGGEWSNSYCGC